MSDNAIIDAVFSPVYGQICWNAKHGYGSFLTMEFGEPSLKIIESRPELARAGLSKYHTRRHVYVRGDWHFWIYCCEWQVTTNGEIIGDSDIQGKTKERIQKAAYELDGQKLLRVSVNPADGTSVFEFDMGSRLETKPYDDSNQWKLFEPSGYVFLYRADGKYSHHPGSTLPEKEVWHSFSEL